MRARVIAAVGPVQLFGGAFGGSADGGEVGGGVLAVNGFAPPQEPLTERGANSSDADVLDICCQRCSDESWLAACAASWLGQTLSTAQRCKSASFGAKLFAELVPSNRVNIEPGKFFVALRWLAMRVRAVGMCLVAT